MRNFSPRQQPTGNQQNKNGPILKSVLGDASSLHASCFRFYFLRSSHREGRGKAVGRGEGVRRPAGEERGRGDRNRPDSRVGPRGCVGTAHPWPDDERHAGSPEGLHSDVAHRKLPSTHPDKVSLDRSVGYRSSRSKYMPNDCRYRGDAIKHRGLSDPQPVGISSH